MIFFSRVIATFLGIGYSPVAPGTMGALALAVLYWFLPTLTALQLLGVICVVIFFGVHCSSVTEKATQEKLGHEKGNDPGIIVIDEVAGMLIALIALPKTLPYVAAAFVLFRVFDIFKPFPVRKFEKLPAGWGIMFDDVMAGIYANLILQIAVFVL
ncbi:MAG: phosphatidylglycerophosphatase A [Candidatus Zhuqueibacterota bacterium]